MKYIVAVSGGVDSVVLLDMLFSESKHELVVAHFDHGIRPESDADARFVVALAEKYGLMFESVREELGAHSSEATARTRRYLFLDSVAKKHNAKIVTAHHQGDVIETIAINLTRGTGWRGLAVLNNSNIVRPLLQKTKQELYDYALKHNLEWVEDETNQTDAYLRNRMRKKLVILPQSTHKKLVDLYENQCQLGREIDNEVTNFISIRRRFFFIMINPIVAQEILRGIVHGRLTRPQLDQLIFAIKTATPGTKSQPSGVVVAHFSPREFIVETPDGMV